MKYRTTLLIGCALVLTGCKSANLADRLGTMKNPYPIMERPSGETKFATVNPFILANYNVLLEATEGTAERRRLDVETPEDMTKYLNAGFALSDIYCDHFFRDAEESQRRRRYGRAITNDVGTAMTTIMGLANAGQDLVTGTAAAFGFGDSLWRNYDEAFVVSPDLSNVKALVLAAQDVFRRDTFAGTLPTDYGKAQTVILRYADLCSTLGMQALLNQSANQQRTQLNELARTPAPSATPAPTPAPAAAPTPSPTPAPAAMPAPIPPPEAAPQRIP
jgi:hypothetical protein